MSKTNALLFQLCLLASEFRPALGPPVPGPTVLGSSDWHVSKEVSQTDLPMIARSPLWPIRARGAGAVALGIA